MPRVAVIAVLIVASAAITLARLSGEDPAAAGPPAPGVSAHPPVAASVPADVPAGRRRFIGRVDRTCERTLRRGRAAQAAYARRVASRPHARRLVTRFYVRWHRGQLRELRALGDPPDARVLYRRWLAGLAARVELEARYAPLLRAGRAAEAQAAAEQANALKLRGSVLARRFGLERC